MNYDNQTKPNHTHLHGRAGGRQICCQYTADGRGFCRCPCLPESLQRWVRQRGCMSAATPPVQSPNLSTDASCNCVVFTYQSALNSHRIGHDTLQCDKWTERDDWLSASITINQLSDHKMSKPLLLIVVHEQTANCIIGQIHTDSEPRYELCLLITYWPPSDDLLLLHSADDNMVTLLRDVAIKHLLNNNTESTFNSQLTANMYHVYFPSRTQRVAATQPTITYIHHQH